jgi:8-oxo-dGTP diphosphatase
VDGARINPQEAAQRYPKLFQEVVWPWGPAQVHFELFLEDNLPLEMIAHVNLVARCGDGWLILRLEDGSWEVPGGTLEVRESYEEAIRRELREEAGAEIEAFRLIGGWHCHSLGDKPYRQHLPFPEFYRAVGVGRVALQGSPGNPAGGEPVVIVECLPLAEVIHCFEDQGRGDLAELYDLASSLENIQPEG